MKGQRRFKMEYRMDALFKENKKQIEKEKSKIRQKRKRYEMIMKSIMMISTLLTGLLVIFLLSYVLVKGIPNLSIEFLTTKPSYITEKIGILPDISLNFG